MKKAVIIMLLCVAAILGYAVEPPVEVSRQKQLENLWLRFDQDEKAGLKAVDEARVKKIKIEGILEEYNFIERSKKDEQAELPAQEVK